MKTQAIIAVTVAALGTVAVVSFCAPKVAPKSLTQPTGKTLGVRAGRKLGTSISGSPSGGRPMVEVESSVGRPYDAKREARDNKYEQFLEQGDRTLAETPGEAEGYYRQASALIPYRPDAWLGLARATDAQGKSAESLPYYKQAFEPPSGSGLYSSFPADIASLARYGALCEENGQHQAALKVYNQACDRLNPKPKIPLQAADLPSPQLRARLDVVRGIALSESKEHSGQDRDTEAMEAFKQAASLEPNDPRVQYYLGYGCQKTGQLTASKTAFEKAARLDTDGTIRAAVKEKLDALAR